MNNMRKRYVALAVSVAAVAAAGCGSSSSRKPTSTASPPATPSAPSTTAITSGPDTPLSSPAGKAYAVASLAHTGLSQAGKQKIADCLIKKFEAKGATTVGEAGALGYSEGYKIGAECTHELHSP